MSSIQEDIIEDIIKFIIAVILGWLFFWTGELIFTAVCLGFHRPRWSGYSGEGALKWVFSETALIILGFIVWITGFPLIYRFISRL